MKRKITIMITLIGMAIIYVLFIKGSIYISSVKSNLSSLHISKESVIKSYSNNKEIFTNIANFAQRDKYDVFIDKDNNKKFIITDVQPGKNSAIDLNNEDLNKNIIELFNVLGYKHVVEEGNAIYFLRQTGIGFECGIVFSKDGNKPNGALINKLEQLNDNGITMNQNRHLT